MKKTLAIRTRLILLFAVAFLSLAVCTGLGLLAMAGDSSWLAGIPWAGAGFLFALCGAAYFLADGIRETFGGDPEYVAEIVHRLADGELSTPVNLSQGADASVLNSLARMQEKLRGIILQIERNAQDVSASVQQMSAQSNEISFASQMQAGSTAQTTETITEITHGINEIANLVNETEHHSNAVADLSVQGESMVSDTMQGMNSIKDTIRNTATQILQLKERSGEVSGIIQLIKGIAEQTNLLALNAAIEAARAGEQGRGFAVVAEEVRRLAERTATATSEISTMIQSIQHETNHAVDVMETVAPLLDAGVGKSVQAAEYLHQIKDRAALTLEKIQRLAQLTDEQVGRARNIVENVEQITEMLKMTDGAVESATQTSVTLERSAANLDQAVKMFNLNGVPK
ncbi:MAG TPA: methyl-accepting chemotaxis protein [Methylococcaceae bacterium]|nr:methyl-accepting chemotaxis protein [Methylococcaceae bacterium]